MGRLKLHNSKGPEQRSDHFVTKEEAMARRKAKQNGPVSKEEAIARQKAKRAKLAETLGATKDAKRTKLTETIEANAKAESAKLVSSIFAKIQ
jgi:hypothetical protein